MLGTIVNCVAIIVGSIVGMLFSRRISQELSGIICSAAGIITGIIGLQMALKVDNIIYLALALIVGGIVGTWLDIDGRILALGRLLERYFGPGSRLSRTKRAVSPVVPVTSTPTQPNVGFAYAFLNASVLFCVGAMAIIGSFKAGTEGDYTILLTKSVLDGFMSIVFAAAMGLGTAFSALSILVYQGLLTLLSVVIKPYVTEQMIAALSSLGGALIVMIGINLLDLKKLKTANYLPSLVIIIGFVLLDPYISKISALFV
jgi:uncharacterized membrane protein YqgA involved in biofilm formation